MAGDNTGLILHCEECGTKNYLDPYSFFNFDGKTKCAGCEAIYSIGLEGGFVTRGPEKADGDPDQLPGYAETADFEPITGAGKTAPPPKALPEVLGKPKPMTQSIRGKPVSGRPLTADELVGSRPRFVIEG